ncbi:hypothetical protein BT96DRAFT_1006771 [Gymnopus androsaceus JB14]|uniref:Uncharacterized protein n=1 Tax=Gymnopus androsaceus JB14 TaxID=1447944 RepID=A0A6A4GK01_9AGAR|nr:hypothetical protein BT96DRAFT_1006771 [Gymnopus androsaceus JB14]
MSSSGQRVTFIPTDDLFNFDSQPGPMSVATDDDDEEMLELFGENNVLETGAEHPGTNKRQRQHTHSSSEGSVVPLSKRRRSESPFLEEKSGKWKDKEWHWAEPDEAFRKRMEETRQRLREEGRNRRKERRDKMSGRWGDKLPEAGKELPHMRYTRFICESREVIPAGTGLGIERFSDEHNREISAFVESFGKTYLDATAFMVEEVESSRNKGKQKAKSGTCRH